ncbi:MAG: class I SAM-dependent methyltransferase, partial [Candidatus Thorarchaeota archaeon]
VEATAIRELLPEKMGEIIIDVGVGTGMSLSVLRGFLGHFIGVDIAWQMIEKAIQKTKNFIKSHLVLADGELLPFREGVAELVVGITVLEFVPNPDHLLREIFRCLIPSGKLLLGVLTSTNLWAMERRIRGLVRTDVFRYARFSSPWQIRRLLHRMGFFDVHYRGSVYAPSFTPQSLLASFLKIDEKIGNRWFWRTVGAFLVIRAQRGLPIISEVNR